MSSYLQCNHNCSNMKWSPSGGRLWSSIRDEDLQGRHFGLSRRERELSSSNAFEYWVSRIKGRKRGRFSANQIRHSSILEGDRRAVCDTPGRPICFSCHTSHIALMRVEHEMKGPPDVATTVTHVRTSSHRLIMIIIAIMPAR